MLDSFGVPRPLARTSGLFLSIPMRFAGWLDSGQPPPTWLCLPFRCFFAGVSFLGLVLVDSKCQFALRCCVGHKAFWHGMSVILNKFSPTQPMAISWPCPIERPHIERGEVRSHQVGFFQAQSRSDAHNICGIAPTSRCHVDERASRFNTVCESAE